MLSGQIQLAPFDVLQTYAPANAQDYPTNLGQIGVTPDGRIFRLGFNNTVSTTLAACKLAQGPAITSGYQGGAVSAQSIGDTQITYTFTGSQTIAANTFANGYLSLITGTEELL